MREITIDDPVAQLREDQRIAREQGDGLAGFATLCTATADQPAARVVTIRQIRPRSVLLSANATSPKAQALAANPRCELLVYWTSLQRQYRLRGTARFVSATEVLELYRQVPWRSKTWDYVYEALPQSTPVARREAFTVPFAQRLSELQARNATAADVPATSSAGYIEVTPETVEVQTLDLEERLHDRQRFEADAQGQWSRTLLVP